MFPRPRSSCLGDGLSFWELDAISLWCSTERTLSGGFVSPAALQFLLFHKEEYRWHGGLQMKETLPDGRIIYELIEFEKIV